MTRRMQTAIKTISLTLTALMTWGTGTTAGAAEAAAATPIDQIQELDEIMVRGTSIRKAIADAEDDFFALYNKLNKDDDYSTSCIYVNTDPDSQIKSRLCIPGFLADALADQVYFAEQCQSPGQDEDGNDFPPPPCYTPPPPTLVLQERSKDYANNLKKVIKSDDRLGSMAGNLDNLYHELVGVQTQYLKVKAAELQAKEPAKASDKSGN